jgi:hypothetical protein
MHAINRPAPSDKKKVRSPRAESVNEIVIHVSEVTPPPGGAEVVASWGSSWPRTELWRRIRDIIVGSEPLSRRHDAAIGELVDDAADRALALFRSLDLPDLARLWIEIALELSARRAVEKINDDAIESILRPLVDRAQTPRDKWVREAAAAAERDVREHLAKKTARRGRPADVKPLTREEMAALDRFNALESKKSKPVDNATRVKTAFPALFAATTDPLKRIRRWQRRQDAGQ